MNDPLVRLPPERRKVGSVTFYYAGCCCSCCCLHTVGAAFGVLAGMLTPASKHVPPAHAALEEPPRLEPPEPPRLEPPVPPPVRSEGFTAARPTFTDALPPVLEPDEDIDPNLLPESPPGETPRRPLLSLGKPFPAASAFMAALALVVLAQAGYSALTSPNAFGDTLLGLLCAGPVYLLVAWALTAAYSMAYTAVRQDDRHWVVLNRIFLFGVLGTILGMVAMMVFGGLMAGLR